MEDRSLRAAYGAHIQHEYVKKKFALRHGLNSHGGFTLPPKTIPNKREANGAAADIPLGASVARLHIALMLRHLGFSNFDI